MRSLRDRLRGAQPVDDAPDIADDAVTAWNSLYTLGIGAVGAVDNRGVVYPDRRPLSVEVWFGVGERWLRGGSRDGVRQRRVDGLPIVETRQRVGESDLVQTAWADESGDGQGRMNIQLANETDDAVIAAVVVRPFTRLAAGSISSIRCAGTFIVADGRPIVDLGREPGDCATALDVERNAPAVLESVSLPTGERANSQELADADGRATLAAMIPLTPGVERTIQVLDGREKATIAPAPFDSVVRGWAHHLSSAGEIDLPTWPNHIFASLASSLLGAVGQRQRPLGDHEWSSADDALLVSALGAIGLGEAGTDIAATLLAGVASGNLERARWPDVAAAIAAVVDANGSEAVLVREREAVATVAGYVLSTSEHNAIAPSMVEAVAISNGHDASVDASQIVGRHGDGGTARALLRHGWSPPPGQLIDLRANEFTDPERVALAMVASAYSGAPSEPLVSLRSAAGSSWRWSRGLCGDSPHVRAQLAIGLVSWCRRLVIDGADRSVDLLPGVRRSWYGQPVSFSRLPVAGSRLSCALRWHGARPALLWEFDAAIPEGHRVTCTALDPTFESFEPSGEVLLGVPPDVQT